MGLLDGIFDPRGSGYDMETALDAGYTRNKAGHMSSLDYRDGKVLKGRKHESWNPMMQTEMSLGNTVEYDDERGRYFSIPGGMYNSVGQDATNVKNIDKLLAENYIDYEQFYQDSPESDYGKPYKYEKDDGESSMSVPLNMRHYAQIMEKAGISEVLTPANRKYRLKQDLESLQDSLIARMQRGDSLSGMVGYYEPGKDHLKSDMKRDAQHKGKAAAIFSPSENPADPDTVRIWDNWKKHTSVLHEPLHGIRMDLPKRFGEGSGASGGRIYRLGHTSGPPFDQASYDEYEKMMMENLTDFYGDKETSESMLDRLLQGKQLLGN